MIPTFTFSFEFADCSLKLEKSLAESEVCMTLIDLRKLEKSGRVKWLQDRII